MSYKAERREKAVALKNEGLTTSQIAEQLGVSMRSVQYWLLANASKASDTVRTMLDTKELDTYAMAKALLKSPTSISTAIKKANLEYDPVKDWVVKAAKTGIKLSYLKQYLQVKDIDRAEAIVQENFPDCFIVRTLLYSPNTTTVIDTVLTPVYNSQKDVEYLNIDTSKKPFKYYISPGRNYMLLQVDDNYGADSLHIPFISDVHVGSIHHRPDLFSNLLAFLPTLSGVLPILGGDLVENNSKYSVAGSMEQHIGPNDQVTKVCKLIAPIAHTVPVSIEGNHEERTERFSEFGIGEVIAQMLKVPFIKDQVVIDLKWRGITKRLLATHKFGKSYSIAAVEAEVLKRRQTLGHFDFTFSGHNHKSFILPEETLNVVEGRGIEHIRWHILNNGSCVGRTGGYAEKFPPAPQDLVYAIIYEDGRTDANKIPILGI